MAIDIRAIKIMLDTNIPGKSPIALTKSMLYQPTFASVSSGGEFPYFTMDIEFPELYLTRLSYEKQVEFFFNKAVMERTLRKFTNQVVSKTTELEFTRGGADTDEQKKLDQSDRSNKNVMILLRRLFPTKYPITGNISSSFASVIAKTPEFTVSSLIPQFLKKTLVEGSVSYSYLKLDGKTYTVSQVIWLNDIYNHIEYGQLVDKFDKLNKWKAKEKDKLAAEIKKKRVKFKTTYTDYLKKIVTTNEQTIPELTNLKKYPKHQEDRIKAGKTLDEVLTREQQTKYATFFDNIDKLVAAILQLQQILNNLTDLETVSKEVSKEQNDQISTTSQQIATFYNTLLKESTLFVPSNKTVLDKFVTSLNRDIEDILISEYILEMYLDRPGINIDFEKDEPKYRDRLKDKYRTYTDFVENIKRFRAPQRESTNPVLQKTIDDFLDNTETNKGTFNFIMNPYNLGRNPFKEELKKESRKESEDPKRKASLKIEQSTFASRMNTGVTLLTAAAANEPYFEIYVQINVIGGELNDGNKSKIDCMYKGETLGDRLEFLMNQTLYYPWSVKSTRIFFDIGAPPEAAPKPAQVAAQEAPKQVALKQGGSVSDGRSITRKIRENFMRTTRKMY